MFSLVGKSSPRGLRREGRRVFHYLVHVTVGALLSGVVWIIYKNLMGPFIDEPLWRAWCDVGHETGLKCFSLVVRCWVPIWGEFYVGPLIAAASMAAIPAYVVARLAAARTSIGATISVFLFTAVFTVLGPGLIWVGFWNMRSWVLGSILGLANALAWLSSKPLSEREVASAAPHSLCSVCGVSLTSAS